MPRSGGIYTLPPGYFATDGTTIEVSQHNPPLEDIAQALTDSLPRDGSAPMTGNLAMGSNKITGLAAATNPSDAVRLDQTTSSAFLTSVSALSLLADEMVYASGTNIAAKTALTAFARQILDDANAAAVRTTIDAQEDVMTTRGDLVTRDASTTVRLPLGASGTVLTSDGTDVTWAAPSGAADYQVFTVDGTWTKPAGVDADTLVWVEMWGAGGSGRSNGSTPHGAGGGGCYARAAFRAGDLAATEAVTVGVGGAAATNAVGNAGGSSSFGAFLSVGGGAGANAGGGAGGSIGTVDKAVVRLFFTESGANGGNSNIAGLSATYAGAGGGGGNAAAVAGGVSIFGGNGGSGGDGSPAATAGTAPGGGGGGTASGATASGAGAAGEVRVWV